MAKNEDVVNVNSVSRISHGTFVKGEVTSPYDIRIDGGFDGKLYSKGKVVVGENAVVKGEFVCSNLDLFGKFEGTIYVKDTLSLKNGCSVDGSINIRKLFVELGSQLNGTCKMITEEDFAKVEAPLVVEKGKNAQQPQKSGK